MSLHQEAPRAQQAAMHQDFAPVMNYVRAMRQRGEKVCVIEIQPATMAYYEGYCFTYCTEDKLPLYIANGAKRVG